MSRYPIVYPVTYLALQADIAKIGITEVIARVRPNYAFARCGYLQGTKIGFTHQSGELCCMNFLATESGQ
jgi:hypothetical protein